MKKIIKIIITFLFLIATYNVVSKAAISATSKTVNSGENFSIAVTSNVSVSAYTVKATGYSGLTFVTSSGGTGAGTVTISDAKATGGMTNLATFQFKAPNVEKDQTFKVSFSASGMGDVNLSPIADSTCIATITVKAKNQSSEQTENNAVQTTTKSNVATLSNLGITPNDFTGFSAGKTSYDVTVPNEVENITVYANKGQSGQKISGTGSKTLKEGLNTFNITVTAEDGKTTKTYTLNITRKESSSSEPKEETTENTEETEKSFGLSDLKIDGVELKPEFKIDVYEYTVTLTDDKDKLDITANPTLQDSKIEITGNENLKEGENTITIIVTDATGEKIATYQVIVNKTLAKETKSENINIKNLSKKQIFIIALAIVALIIIIIIVVAVKKANKEEYEYYNGEIPYANLSNDNEQNENEKQIEKNNEEAKKKKKHSKGKRFK